MTERNDHTGKWASLSAAKRALLEKRLRGALDPDATGRQEIKRRPPQAPATLSSGQQRLWFLHQLAPESPAYNMYQAIRLAGPLDVAVLKQSIHEVVRRHEVLRTTCEETAGQPVLRIAPHLTLNLPVADLRAVPEAGREAAARAQAAEEARRPFDLREGPLIRVVLLRLREADHVLVLTMHHLVSDEWSLDVFWREVAALYGAFLAGQPSPLPELPLQYADYAAWQWARLESPDLERQLTYWKQQLGGDLPVLQLPTDHPRPAQQTFRGALQSLRLPPALTEALKRLSKQEGVTLFMLLLAAFKTLLHRYTGQTDLIVGAPVTNRDRAEVEGLIGFFINTLVLRADLSGDPPFLEVLKRVRHTVLEAFAHQDVPFEKLVDELKPERRLSHNPLFQVMFVLQQEPALQHLAPGLPLRPFPLETGASKFDLTLFMLETDGQLTATFEYSTDLFNRASIDRMLEHLHVLLKGIAAAPDRRLSELPLLTEMERRQLLSVEGAAQTDVSAAACVHHLFEEQAARTPDAVAVLFQETPLTYRALNRRANHLAHRLRYLGVGPDVCVGLCVERSLDMVVGILGILKAGGAYVPLEPTYPPERLRFMLEDTAAPVLLTQQHLVPTLPETGAHVHCLDADTPDSAPDTAPAQEAGSDQLAYVIYTSGSTGQPKGVLVTHGNLAHSTGARRRYYAEPPGRFLLLSSFAFDSSVAGLFWPLCTGGTLVLPRPRLEQDMEQLAALIAQHQVTHTLCLPSLYSLILEHAQPHQLTSLRTVIVAGEVCPPALGPRHHALLPQTRLYNEYGPTEATVWSTVYEVPPRLDGHRVPIGRPIAGVRVYLLDAHRQPVPLGVQGEVYIGGAGVARGYLNRPALTAERFVPDPFSGHPEARLYRTGDLARCLPDGTLEFLGRTDHQIKVRGYRIEPGEVEAALLEHPAVREAVAVAHGARPEWNERAEHTLRDDPDTLGRHLLGLSEEEADRLLEEIEQLTEAEAARLTRDGF